MINWYKKTSNRWMLEKIYDYWDFNQNALERYGNEFDKMDALELEQAQAQVAEAIDLHVSALSDSDLMMSAFVMADDLMKTGNALIVWNSGMEDFLYSSATVFLTRLRERGYLLHYITDNLFFPVSITMEELPMQRPIQLFPDLFRSAGFIYICPQQIAMMVKKDLDPLTQNDPLVRYIKEGQRIAHMVVDHCLADSKHYCFVNGDDREGNTIEYCLPGGHPPGIITVYRTEPPVPNSKCHLFLPDKPLIS